jgi:hypothetical protein
MSLNDVLTALQALPFSTAIAESDWLFPTIESLHVIAITLVVGSIIVVDLRLIGVAAAKRPLAAFTAQFLPITWSAFALAALTGALMFLAKPVSYVGNVFFLSKLILLLAAGLNMGVFHLFLEGPAHKGQALGAARASGLASLTIWIGVVALGRWIGFTI